MKRSKNSSKRKEKRREAAIKKHELKTRIRELERKVFESIGLSLAVGVVSELVAKTQGRVIIFENIFVCRCIMQVVEKAGYGRLV